MIDSVGMGVNPMLAQPNMTAVQISQMIAQRNQPSPSGLAFPDPIRRSALVQLRLMCPPVIWKNVFRAENAHLDSEDCEYIRLTFYNDQSVIIKMKLDGDTATALCDDFEEWTATAIMKCEAGEDIWERPKQLPPSAVASSQNFGAANSLSNLQAGSLHRQGLGNPGGSFGQAAGLGLAALHPGNIIRTK